MTTTTAKSYKKDYTHPELREKLKQEIKEGDKGGRSGQWSARKSQLLKQAYEKQGGGYKHKDHKTEQQKSLHQWSQEDWQTDTGDKAVSKSKTKRYLPKKVWDELTPTEKKQTSKVKESKDPSKQQYVANTKKVVEKVKKIKEKV